MIFARGQDKSWALDRAQVQRAAAQGELAWYPQIVLQVGVAQVPGVESTGQVGAVAVPVQQIEGARGLTLEVVVDHERPHQLVSAQAGEGGGKEAARHQAAVAISLLALPDVFVVDIHADLPYVAEVEHGGEQS